MTKLRLTSVIGSILASLFGTAYGVEGPDSLAAARALWSKAAPASYSYVVEHSSTVVAMCRVRRSEFLPQNPVRVSIRAGGVVRVATLRGRTLPDSCLLGYYKNLYSIDGLFNLIEQEEKQTNPTGARPCLKIAFDDTFGFPRKIDSDCYLDGDHPIDVRDFRVLK
jgi:hypothetical protein